MKKQSKLASIGAVATTIALLAPAFAFAAPTPEERGLFCANLSTIAAKVTANIPKREDFRNQKLDAGMSKVGDRLQLRLTKIDDKRETWDADRKARYAKLEAAAKTPEQQAAVKTFESTIDAAVATRHSAVDAAVATFQKGVNDLLSSRQAQMDAAFATLTSSTQAAIAKATASCATSAVDVSAVRTQFVADMKAANDAFRTAVKPTNIRSSMEALRATRDAAIRNATESFKTTMQQATATLKAAFGR